MKRPWKPFSVRRRGRPAESPSEFFLDRSLGRHVVAAALRAEGLVVQTLAERYPETEEFVEDEVWIREGDGGRPRDPDEGRPDPTQAARAAGDPRLRRASVRRDSSAVGRFITVSAAAMMKLAAPSIGASSASGHAMARWLVEGQAESRLARGPDHAAQPELCRAVEDVEVHR